MSRRASLALMTAMALVVVCVLLTACAQEPSFRPPIKWGGSDDKAYFMPADPSAPLKYVRTTLTLQDGTKASVTDFPAGHVKSTRDGMCVETLTNRSYSGAATWSVVNSHELKLKFAQFSAVVVSDHGLAGSQDWTGLRIPECDAAYVHLTLRCGVPGYGGQGEPAPGVPAKCDS